MPSIVQTQLSRRADNSVDILPEHTGMVISYFDDPAIASHRYSMVVEAQRELEQHSSMFIHSDPREYFREARFVLDNNVEYVVSLLP